MPSPDDALIRHSAFLWLDNLVANQGVLTWDEIEAGFPVPGLDHRVRFATRAKGIFKPKEMHHILSIKTVMPRPGRKVWYADQNKSHDAIFGGSDAVSYSFRGSNPDAPDNLLLKHAADHNLPLVYLVAVAPAVYCPFYPVFVTEWNATKLEAKIVFSLPEMSKGQFPINEIERRYALRLTKQRLHQAKFRLAVIDAYGGRCAITRMPAKQLLDASHIMPDSDEELGHPIVRNGLPLSKIHHAAYDANLIGIDADGVVHVSERLLSIHDGPFLEYGIKAMQDTKILLPDLENDRPDRERLARRFELFVASA